MAVVGKLLESILKDYLCSFGKQGLIWDSKHGFVEGIFFLFGLIEFLGEATKEIG